MSNPSGLYSRIKTWSSTDTILGSDLNAEFDNILSNFNPEMLAGYSQNVTEMQTQTSPGAVGSESLATSLSDELARLRYQIAAITGNTYWYTPPAVSLSQANSLLGASAFSNKINSGLTAGTTGSAQPMFLLAANTTNSVTLKATSTAFSYAISGTTYSVSTDTTLTGLTAAPSSQNTATVADLTLPQAGTASTQLLGENGSTITVSGMGTNITALVGQIAAFKTTASEYILGRIESTTQIRSVYRGYFFNSSNTLVTRGTLANGDTLTLMKLAWIYINTAGVPVVGYTNPTASGVAPTSPATSDYWFDTSLNYWKIYNGSAWIQANVTLIGLAITDTANTVATRSFDFFKSYADTNTCELFADSQNSGTVVRTRMPGALVSVYGSIINVDHALLKWDFATNMDTGAQAASTFYYFYLDTNGKPFISKTAPHDRRGDLKGYYHPGLPWRCLGYGFSNSATLLENVESFYRSDDSTPVSNITAASVPILPMNIVQREQVITLTGAAGAFTQVLPPPHQLKGKYITYIRTDNNLGNAVTLQSWGTAVTNQAGTLSITSNPTTISGLASTTGIAAGQLITGPGIAPNTTVVSAPSSSTVVMSTSALITSTNATFNFANAAGLTGTVGQQPGYANYGIDGAFTTTLNTQYEQVTITSDGFAYFIVNRYFPGGWILSGALNITATTTAPAKGTTTSGVDQMWWRRVGNSAEIRLEYKQTAAGTAGSGDYLFTLPTNLTADTNRLTLFGGAAVGTNTYLPATILGHTMNCVAASATGGGGVLPYDSTHVRLMAWQGGTSTNGLVGSGYFATSNNTVSYSAAFTVPILGWSG